MASPEIVVLAEAPRKKARKQNFSPTEIATLTEKVEENLAILQSKLTNSITNARATSETARDTVDLSTPTVSPITCRKLPLAKNLSAISTW